MRGAIAALHGNRLAREMLDQLLEREALPHALCFAGPMGVGKRTVALALAKGLNCVADRRAGCACPGCRKIDSGSHPDVRTFAAESTTFKIDQVREVLGLVRLRPYEGAAKVFILDDADTMNEEASNALLKTLEEPPPATYLVLTTSRPDSLLATIRSRCRTVKFWPLPRDEVVAILQERGMPAQEAVRRALFAAGSVGTALALDLPAVEARRARVLGILKELAQGPPFGEVVQVARAESAEREELEAVLEVWKELARDMALLARGGSDRGLAHPDIASDLAGLARSLPAPAPLAIYREVESLHAALRHNVARQLGIEVLLLRVRELMSPLSARE